MAVLAIVVATFSTGIDSKCFQVLHLISPFFLKTCWKPKIYLTAKFVWQQKVQFWKDDKQDSEEEEEEHKHVPYGYGFFHFVFATGAMYFAMLLIGWNAHHSMKK